MDKLEKVISVLCNSLLILFMCGALSFCIIKIEESVLIPEMCFYAFLAVLILGKMSNVLVDLLMVLTYPKGGYTDEAEDHEDEPIEVPEIEPKNKYISVDAHTEYHRASKRQEVDSFNRRLLKFTSGDGKTINDICERFAVSKWVARKRVNSLISQGLLMNGRAYTRRGRPIHYKTRMM